MIFFFFNATITVYMRGHGQVTWTPGSICIGLYFQNIFALRISISINIVIVWNSLNGFCVATVTHACVSARTSYVNALPNLRSHSSKVRAEVSNYSSLYETQHFCSPPEKLNTRRWKLDLGGLPTSQPKFVDWLWRHNWNECDFFFFFFFGEGQCNLNSDSTSV